MLDHIDSGRTIKFNDKLFPVPKSEEGVFDKKLESLFLNFYIIYQSNYRKNLNVRGGVLLLALKGAYFWDSEYLLTL